jgi:dTDP-4-dehydrorhamnose reductase
VRLIVTGAAGMLGHDVVIAARAAGHEVTGLTHAELDLVDGPATVAALASLRPAAVVNCAAYTDVDGAQGDESGAHAGNAQAPGNLAVACHATGARLVHVSTDYVFDGNRPPDGAPWVESDPTGPLGVYGQSKLAGEHAVAASCDDHAIVRTAWLFGTRRRSFVTTILALAQEREEIDVVTDQVGSPTFSGHLAPALVAMAQRPDTGLFHGAGAGSCSWYELAVSVLAQAGVRCHVAEVTSEHFPRPAPRPAFSVLGSERDDPIVLPTWQDGVRGYLTELHERATA